MEPTNKNPGSESSLDRIVGGIVIPAIRIILFITFVPLLFAYWGLVAAFILYVGLPCYIIKRLSPKMRPFIDAFFDNAWNKIVYGHRKFIHLFLGSNDDSDEDSHPDERLKKTRFASTTKDNDVINEENKNLAMGQNEMSDYRKLHKTTFLLIIIIVVILVITLRH